MTPDDGLVYSRSGLGRHGAPSAGYGPAMAARMLCLLFGWCATLGPGDDSLHLGAKMVLSTFLVAKIGRVHGHGGQNLQDSIDENPATPSSFEGIEVFNIIRLLKADVVGHQVSMHVLITERIHVGGLGVRKSLAPGLGNLVGRR